MSADFLSQDIAHNFVGGSSIGETIKFIGTLGLQADFYSAPTAQVYLLGGLALVEKEFTINFIGAGQATSDQWLWGGTLGAGFAFSPQALQFDNRQVTVFVQFQHIWVEDANWSSPAPSPAFTYQFSNGMDIFKFGARVPIGMH